MILTGKKIVLRFPNKKDIDRITMYCGDKAISEFTFIPFPYTQKDAEEFIEFATAEREAECQMHFAITLKESGELIGMIGLNEINDIHARAEVGYWMAVPYWGKGYTTEAVKLMLAFCFTELALERVFAYVQPENEASWRVLEKCRFQREGLLRKQKRRGEKFLGHFLYGIVKEDFLGSC